jgi:hypothetical protein
MITKLYSIAYGCPKGKKDDDCPLREIDHLSFDERINWIDELSKEKKEFILTHHSFCTKRK